MRKWLMSFFMWICFSSLVAQENLQWILISGVEDSQEFASGYLKPGAEAAVYNLANGWYQSAEVKNPLGFEISILGNASMNLSEHQSFFLNAEEYHNVEFTSGSLGEEVATLFGRNEPGLEVRSFYEIAGEQRVAIYELPQGVGSSETGYFPFVFVQARLGIFKGTEIKARYFPRINYNDVEAGLFGGALQHEFTSWIPGSNLFPIALSGLIGYTQMQGKYNFTQENYIDGENQVLDALIKSWLFTVILSTKFPVLNLYGGMGYVIGSSETKMLGLYEFKEAPGATILTIEDPLTVQHKIDGLVGTLGGSIKLGILKLHVDYNFQEYNSISVGFHVGF